MLVGTAFQCIRRSIVKRTPIVSAQPSSPEARFSGGCKRNCQGTAERANRYPIFRKLRRENEDRMKHSYAEKQPDVDELISTHSELVRKIAWQIHGRARHITEIEDLVQIGYTGLIVAAQKYTPLEGKLCFLCQHSYSRRNRRLFAQKF